MICASDERRQCFAPLVLLLLLSVSGGCASPGNSQMSLQECRVGSRPMARVELLFSHPESTAAQTGEEMLAGFLEREVTPRFPEGFTLVDGKGQWRAPSGKIEKSASHVLVIWYPPSAEADSRIEAIRDAYKRRFAQISVMRVDGHDCVSF